ncbi:hypothetical protein JL720_11899 [Aureococcus anophagefferens]|nr:hypothetical protein JL720_11899 [Aureococcus anophagefferens]
MAQHNDEIHEFQQYHLFGNSEDHEYWPVVTTVECINGQWRVRYEDGSHGVVDASRLWPAPHKERKAGEPVQVLYENTYYDARATGDVEDDLVEVEIDLEAYYSPPDGAVQLIPAHHVFDPCAVIDDPDLYKSFRNAWQLKSCVGDDAYDGSKRQKQVAAGHGRRPGLERDGPAVFYKWLGRRRCRECGREGARTGYCMCAGEGVGRGLLGNLAASALRNLFPDGILPGEAGYPEVANCELLTGASSVEFLMKVLRAMTGLGSSELDEMLSRTVPMRIRKTMVDARETQFDHIIALSLRYPGAQLCGDAAKLAAPWRLDEDPAWVAGAPNGATPRSRMEGLQLLLRKANLDKGATISREIVDDLLDYDTCFYAPSELAKPDVLDRTHRGVGHPRAPRGKKRHQRPAAVDGCRMFMALRIR